MSLANILCITVLLSLITFGVCSQEDSDKEFQMWLHGGNPGESQSKTPTESEEEVKTERKQILDSLSEVGVNEDDVKRPAKTFLLKLYEDLQSGKSIMKALSDSGKFKEKALKKADTIRSFSAKGDYYCCYQ